LSGIVDSHVHLSERQDDILNIYAKRNGLRYTLAELLGLMEENGVVRGLLLSPIMGTRAPLANEDVLKFCQKSRGKLHPILTVEPTPKKVKSALGLAESQERSVKGFKVMLGYARVFAYDPVFEPLYEYAESKDLPVMFHTGDTADATGSLVHAHPLTLDTLANRRTGLKIIACHFGNPWIDDVAELIYKHENVYTDISGLIAGGGRYLAQYVDWLAQRISRAIYFAGGADKVIFGTDYPVTTPSQTLSLVDKLEIDAGDRQKILAGNAKRVFRI
jgi:predicted TIM-barrel fold metal-dependent hydrolase